MAKGGKKKGPPYVDDPGCKYVVIIDPWGMDSAKNRTPVDVDRLGSWVTFMLRAQSESNEVLLEVVYMRGTQNEVILQLSENADLGPLLGEHRWPEFLKCQPTNSSCTASYLLEYNYTANGKPDNHNWADYYPESKPLFPAFKADIAYPRAHYANATRFGHLRSLVLPLPKERERTPTPPPTDDLFSPYEPPAHHPSHSKLYPEIKAENADRNAAINHPTQVSIKAEEEEQKPRQPDYIEKYDPYDEEETARLALRADPPKAAENRVTVKQEEETPISADDEEYKPTVALLESVALFEASRIKIRDSHEGGVKTEPDAGGGIFMKSEGHLLIELRIESEYQPSSAWIETMQMHKQDELNHRHRDVAVKVEPQQDRYTPHRREYGAVKIEPNAHPLTFTDSIPGQPRGLYQGRPPSGPTSVHAVKQEPTHSADRVSIPAVPQATRDPRQRPMNIPLKRLKDEDEGSINNVGFAKKMKVAKN